MLSLAPSDVPIRTKQLAENSYRKGDEPEVLTVDGIKKVIEEFRKGAENEKITGFDEIKLHGANWYLVDEFLKDCTNKRTDRYGGSIENRCNFLIETIEALISVFGADRIGVKLSPCNRYNDMYDSDPVNLYK